MLMAVDFDRRVNATMAKEVASTLLALKRPVEALAELSALESPLLDVKVAALFITCAAKAGEIEVATSIAKQAAACWPTDAKLAARRAEIALAAGQADAAMEALTQLPADRRDSVAVRKARASILYSLESWTAADEIYTALIDEGAYDGAIVIGKFRTATKLGVEGDELQRLAISLDEKIAASSTNRWSKLHMRIELAIRLGDWAAVLQLSDALCALSPTDLFVSLSRAEAHLALGDLAAALDAVTTFLKREPKHQQALELNAQLALARGKPDIYLEQLVARTKEPGGDMEASVLLARSLFLIGRDEEAKQYLAMCREMAPTISDAALKTELLLQGENLPDAARDDDPAVTAITHHELSEQDIRSLLDYSRSEGRPFTDQHNALALAWSVYGGEPMRRSSWIGEAVQANRSRKLMARARPPIPLDMLEAPDLSLVEERLTSGQPIILAMSHFGPLVGPALLSYIPGLHYVANHMPPSEDYGELISGLSGANNVAVSIYQKLRLGSPVAMSPDSPAAMMRRGKAGGHARASLFGLRCAILNTIPKFSREMNIPSYWLQPRWRDGRIGFELAALPTANPDESPQLWYDRWAQAYMDHVADIMTSSPRNQNLNAPLWRYLLLKGAGALA